MRHFVTLLLMACTMASCTRWSAIDRPLPQLLPEEGPRPDRLRVHTARGDWLVLLGPRLRNDSIVGIDKRSFEAGVPLSEVRMVQRLQVDAGNTVGVAVFVIGTAAAVIGMQGMSDLFRK